MNKINRRNGYTSIKFLELSRSIESLEIKETLWNCLSLIHLEYHSLSLSQANGFTYPVKFISKSNLYVDKFSISFDLFRAVDEFFLPCHIFEDTGRDHVNVFH